MLESIDLACVAIWVLGNVLLVARNHVDFRIHMLLQQVESLLKQHGNVDSDFLTNLASWESEPNLVQLVLRKFQTVSK